MTPVRVLVSGYYGFDNLGDEAVLAGLAESFRRQPRESTLTVLSASPDATRHQHGLDAVERMRMPAVRAAIRECDLFLSGGGSLLQDATSVRSVLYYLWVVRMALAAGKPVMFYAQGVGPLRSRLSRFLVRYVADRVQRITVRDADSATLLREIGVSSPPVEVTADPAFALSPAEPGRISRLLSEAGIDEAEKLIGMAPRPWHHPRPTVEDYAQVANQIADSGARVVLLPMQRPSDLDLCESIAARTKGPVTILRSPLSPIEAVGVTERLSALLAMRLHPLIFAASVATPMVALSYDPKVRSLMALLGQPSRAIDLDRFDVERTLELVHAALAHRESTRAELKDRTTSLRQLAYRNAELALGLVRRT